MDDKQRKQLEGFESRLAKFESIKALHEKRGDHKKAEKAQKQIAKLIEKLKPLRQRRKMLTDDLAKTLPPEEIINQAYLRTLSRFPTEDERLRCLEYFDEEADAIDGLKDILWALLNTKEFVVNH